MILSSPSSIYKVPTPSVSDSTMPLSMGHLIETTAFCRNEFLAKVIPSMETKFNHKIQNCYSRHEYTFCVSKVVTILTGSLVSFIFNNQAQYKCIRDPPRNSSSSCLKISLNTIHSAFSSSWSEKEFYHLDIRSLLILIEVPDMALPPWIAEQPLAACLPLHTGQVWGVSVTNV